VIYKRIKVNKEIYAKTYSEGDRWFNELEQSSGTESSTHEKLCSHYFIKTTQAFQVVPLEPSQFRKGVQSMALYIETIHESFLSPIYLRST
jgi:hypothetical protein